MKKVVVLVLLIGVTAFAQRNEHGNRDRIKELTPEQIATLKTKKATLALDLTVAQQTQIKVFFTEAASLRKAKIEERKAQKESKETKTLTSEERYTKVNARLDYQIEQKAKLKEILSEAQFEKWKKIKHRKRKGYKEKRQRSRK